MEAEQQEEEEETVQVEQEEEEKVEDLAPACRTARPPPQVLTMGSQPKVRQIKILLLFRHYHCTDVAVLRHTAGGLKTEEVKCTHRAGRFGTSQPL